MVRQLSMSLWVGGLCFFAFVVAPVAFGVLPDTHLAGLVVGGTLGRLHGLGLVAGCVFLVTTGAGGMQRLRLWEVALTTVMVGLTAVSQFGILPRMNAARDANGGVVRVEDRGTAAARFQMLHRLSEKVEGTVLLAGLGVLGLMAVERRDGDRSR